MRGRSRWLGLGALALPALLSLPLPSARADEAALVRIDEATNAGASAERYFASGEELFRSQRYAEALSAFQGSLALQSNPQSSLMAARCLRALGRLPEAHEQFQVTVRATDADSPGAAKLESAARSELAELASELAFVVVETESGVSTSEFRLGERSFSSEALGRPIAVVPGKLSLSARIDGQERQQLVSARSGATSRAVLSAPPTPRSKARARGRVGDTRKSATPVRTAPFPLRTAAFIASGTGVASALAFGVLAPLSASRSQALERSCPAGRCSAIRADEIAASHRLETVAQVGLAAAVLGIGTGITLYLAAPRKREQAPSVSAVFGPRSLKLEGSF